MTQTTALTQAEALLLAPFSLTERDLARTFGQILTHQVDYADLYFQYSRSEAWSLDEGIVKSGSFNIDQGVGVRALSGEKTAFAYSDDISARALSDAAQAVRAIASAGQNGILPTLQPLTAARNLYLPNDPLASLPA
ncbi:MAG: DNA gyrase modulator, partial [Azonexus sp.]|nr:DNA gyrase modulator [Azonexus sp.]